MQVLFLFTVNRAKEGGNKKAATTCLIAARDEPIRLAAGQVNRVMRIGAYSWGKPKKLPWKSLRTEFDPVKGLFPQRAGQSRPRPDVFFPSFASFRNGEDFPGAKIGDAFDLDISPYEVELASSALPRFDPPSARRRVGEVSRTGRMRSGADREARLRCLCSPYKRKADLCAEKTGPQQPHQKEK